MSQIQHTTLQLGVKYTLLHSFIYTDAAIKKLLSRCKILLYL